MINHPVDFITKQHNLRKLTASNTWDMLTNKQNLHSKMTEYLVTQAKKAIFVLQGDTKQSLR